MSPAIRINRTLALSIGLRALLGLLLISLIPVVCLDDDIRIFYARWWFDQPSFAPSKYWLPGHSYFYGVIVGLFNDASLMPRLATLILHLGLGALVYGLKGVSLGVRRLAWFWISFSPLSLVLGTVPLSETLFLFTLFGAVVLLVRYLEGGRISTLLGASLLYLAAATVRFEGWVLLPVFALFACGRSPLKLHRAYAVALGLLPMVVPITWSSWLYARFGDPFFYLQNIKTDHLGAGDLAGAVADPTAWLSVAQSLAVAAVVGAGLVQILRRRRRLDEMVFEVHAGVALVLLGWAVFSENTPSQYPLRLLYPAIVLGAVPLATQVEAWRQRVQRRTLDAALVGLFGAGALVYALGVPAADHQPSRQVTAMVDQMNRDGYLSESDHMLIDKQLPDSQRLYVYLGRFDTVHINHMGTMSPVDLLGCAPGRHPRWAGDVKAAIVHIQHSERARWLVSRGWQVFGRNDTWVLLYNPGQAQPLGSCD